MYYLVTVISGTLFSVFGADTVILLLASFTTKYSVEFAVSDCGSDGIDTRYLPFAVKTPRSTKPAHEARGILDQAGIAYQFHITVGDPAEMIVRFATEKQYDLIVMGPRGRGGLKGLLLGSVTSKVMQLSQIPVLLVK